MSPQQKVAWFNLAVLGGALVLYVVLFPILGPTRALGAFGVCGLWGLGPLFYRQTGKPVILDERDRLISIRAQVAGLWIFWEFLVAACMITWATLRYYHHQYTISVDALPLLILGGFVIFTASHSIAVLVQYGRRPSDEIA